MSRLQVFAEDDPARALVDTGDAATIAATLAEIGVTFERWAVRQLSADDEGSAVLLAYADEIERLKAAGGYQSVDVVRVAPDHPDRAAMRLKFLSEHTHAEDEVRFFVDGAGLFTLRAAGRVWNVLACGGDLISVPAGMTHWFDMGAHPSFTAIRLFGGPDGWVASFTGSDIADRFPRYEPA